jgi:hypothetical protein
LIKKAGGITDPKLETVHSINQYSKSLAIDSSSIIFVRDSSSWFEVDKIFPGSPDILVFNENKEYLPYREDSTTCNGPIDNVLKSICQFQSSIVSKRKVQMDNLMKHCFDPNGCMSSYDAKNYDYTVFIDYAKYFNGVNKTHIIPWNDIIRNNNTPCRVKYIYVNTDYLQEWGVTKKSLPKFKIKAL